ncbi:uncharacterized protein LOC114250734 [Bombyx mandarina]|uniref:Uncharacterized protein LOC114250734 n=1 Tax=Bombyx mandarina TaxID=7092 RepID=A0A6J2KHV4_BOMMA|nr:uncharacterized protein LOC114250734 [Bombyx mandarina]
MEGGGRQSRLLSRLLGRLRGDHHKYNLLDKRFSVTSSGVSENIACGSMTTDEEEIDPVGNATSNVNSVDPGQFATKIDQRYGGQYLTPDQLPEFCAQLHHLVEVIRNIQSYAKVTGEYPSELERRLEQEAREVASLAAEARNARDVVSRTRTQRKAVRAQKKQVLAQLNNLRETEVRELESTVRLSDRKLFKSWEALKDSTDPTVFEPLLEEIKNRQTALDCLVRLIESRRSKLARIPIPLHSLPPLEPRDNDDSCTTYGRKRHDSGTRKSNYKRRRKENNREPRSVPLSSETSRHGPMPQVTLLIQGAESSAGRAAAELSTAGSVRDILFFTTT